MQFDLVAVSILFGFYFRLSISTSKISNLLLPLGIKGRGGGGGGGGGGPVNLDVPYFSLLLHVAFEKWKIDENDKW